MEYAARLPKTPSRRTMVAPIVALLVGAGAATGAYALIDNGDTATQAAKVIVVEKPTPNAAVIPGKNEASTAAAISQSPNAAVIPGKNEAVHGRGDLAVGRHRAAWLQGERDQQAVVRRAVGRRGEPHRPARSGELPALAPKTWRQPSGTTPKQAPRDPGGAPVLFRSCAASRATCARAR